MPTTGYAHKEKNHFPFWLSFVCLSSSFLFVEKVCKPYVSRFSHSLFVQIVWSLNLLDDKENIYLRMWLVTHD